MAKLLSNTRIYGTGTVDTQLFVKGFQSSHNTTTGALQVSGGIGVAGGGFFSGTVTATNFIGAFSGTASLATDLAGGTAGQLLYQIAPNDTGFVGPGTAGQILVSAGAAIPVYTNTGSIYVGFANRANGLLSGTAGQLVYQSAVNTTAFTGPGTAGQVLTSGGSSAPIYVNTTTLYVGDAVTSTNLRGGTANQFAYQTGANATAFISTGSMYVGRAVIADSVVGAGAQVQTTAQTANASYFLTFVDSNNASATAETVYTTSSLVVNPGTGNIGIGAGSTLTKLVVDGLPGGGWGSKDAQLLIRDTRASATNIGGAITFGTSNYGTGAIGAYAEGTGQSSYLQLSNRDSTGSIAERVRIISNGNVGIGLIAPSYKLDVDGVIQGRQGLRTGLGYNSYVSDRLQFAASTGITHHQFKQTDIGGSNSRLDLRRSTGTGDGFDGGEMITFLSNGYVGINTTAPTSRLHVVGDVRIEGVVTATTFIGAFSGTAALATDVAGGTAGQLLYQIAPNDTGFVGPGTAGQLLVSAGTGAPTYVNTGSLYVGRAVLADSATNTTGNAATVSAQQRTNNADHFLTFVDSNNLSATAETIYTTSSFVINPATGNVGWSGFLVNGTVLSQRLSRLSTNYVNNPTTSGNIWGWGNIKEDGSGTSSAISYDATEQALRITTSGNYGVHCQRFPHDPNKIYRIKLRIKKDVASALIYIGVTASTTFSNGGESTGNQAGNLSMIPVNLNRTLGTASTNVYLWVSTSGSSPTTYQDVEIYILGANIGVDEFPDWKLPSGSSRLPAAKVSDLTTPWIGLRILNWANSSSASVFVRDISITEVSPSMVVRNEGNVGIGITNPTNTLHVLGSGITSRFQSNTANSAITIAHSGNGGTIGYINTGTGNQSNLFYITTGAGTVGSGIVIDNGGNVGIGTSTPTSKFHVNHNGQTTSAFYVDVGNPSNATTLFEHTGANTPVTFRLRKSGYSGAAVNYGLLYLHMNDNTAQNGSSLYFTLNDSASNEHEYGGIGALIRTNTNGAEAGDLFFMTSDAGSARSEKMRIVSNGNVGIGTNNPNFQLDISGTARATADFRAPIFYDSNNTAFFTDPASTSRLNVVTLDGISCQDTRATATTPQTYNSIVRWDFKTNTTNGLSDGGTYNGVMYWRKYGSSTDWSGGGAVELAYTDNARMWMRYGSTTSWGAWKRFIFGDNFDNGGIIRTSGGVSAANFYDGTGTYNVNLGSGASEGRGLVAGYSGGSYGGIGYNVRHTTTGGQYIAPLADTSNYLTFSQGFTFSGAVTGAAGRTLSYTTLGTLNNSGQLSITTDIRTPIFYDSNNTAYYLDPASTSRVNILQFASGSTGGPYFYYGNNERNLYLRGAVGSDVGLSLFDSSGNWRVQIYGSSGNYGFLNANWAGWDIRKVPSGSLFLNNQSTYYIDSSEIYYNRVYGVTDIRSPIFYDLNNTAYYVDPASYNRLNRLVLDQSRVDSSRFPVGHYTPSDTVFEIDTTWTDDQLQAYFNSSGVYWTADSTAPGGYAIRIDGSVNVGGVYGSGFPYIPVDQDDIFYMECWIKSVDGSQGHYMGSIDYNHSLSSLGGNPGSFGYWTMINTTTNTSWQKVSGYITGFGTSTGQFRSGTKYWTPQALFNYTQYSGTRSCIISGWKAIKVRHPGNRTIAGSLGVGTAASGTTGEIRATNEITAYYSDRRLKENVEIIADAIDKIKSLHGIKYTPNDLAVSFGYDKTKKLVGLFADEVEAVLPEAVRLAPFDSDINGQSKSGYDYKTIQYEKLVPLLIEAMKEQDDKIDKLQQELTELRDKYNSK
jgi:hypothetical protein